MEQTPSLSPPCYSQMCSSIAALSLDTLVHILCKLNHDELKPLHSVSKSFHDAALVAQQLHFDFSTPAAKRTMAFSREMDRTPAAPLVKANAWNPRKIRLSYEDTRKITVELFPAGTAMRSSFKSPEWGLPITSRARLFMC